LHDSPNENQTSFEFREVLVAYIALWGECFALKVEKATGIIQELIPLNPANMSISIVDGRPFYEYTYEDGKKSTFDPNKIWHIKNMPISSGSLSGTPPGIRGMSPISLAKDSIGISMAADQYGGRYFANNASVGMGLKFPQGVRLSDNAKQFLKESLAEYGKIENKFKSIILEDGGQLEKIGMSNEDSQFLETRQFGVEEICRIFRVPPIMVGHPTNTMTYASAEQLFLAFATYTIRPWCVRIEQSANMFLLNDRERSKYFFEFNLAGLLRGDTVSRYNAYAVARNWGWMNVDEIRTLENMNPLPEGKGKFYLQPLNMTEPGGLQDAGTGKEPD
jgi:HK97 family phage portal protein